MKTIISRIIAMSSYLGIPAPSTNVPAEELITRHHRLIKCCKAARDIRKDAGPKLFRG
jgi:hypothetical protein